jgi:hypothetical protein
MKRWRAKAARCTLRCRKHFPAVTSDITILWYANNLQPSDDGFLIDYKAQSLLEKPVQLCLERGSARVFTWAGDDWPRPEKKKKGLHDEYYGIPSDTQNSSPSA